MKKFQLSIPIIVNLLVLGTIALTPTSAIASAQPNSRDVVEDNLPELNRDLAKDIADFWGLGGLFDGVLDFFEAIEETNELSLEVRSPDWNTIRDTIEGTDTRAKELGRQLEDRTSDSYHIERDESEQIQRELIQDSISTTTTSKDAREALAASLVEIEAALKKSGELSKDSADTDVSQQILQNLSEQSGINTQLLGTISAQNIQAQKDRSNQINLALQQARHNAIATTRARRQASIANDLGISAWGTISTPTFLYVEKP